jgi:hypothetical protein
MFSLHANAGRSREAFSGARAPVLALVAARGYEIPVVLTEQDRRRRAILYEGHRNADRGAARADNYRTSGRGVPRSSLPSRATALQASRNTDQHAHQGNMKVRSGGFARRHTNGKRNALHRGRSRPVYDNCPANRRHEIRRSFFLPSLERTRSCVT